MMGIAIRCTAGFYHRSSFLPLDAVALPASLGTMPIATDLNLRRRALSWIVPGIVCVVWGTTYRAIRVGVLHLPPLFRAGSRFLLAGTVPYPIAWRRLAVALQGG